jgi:hypothetical protein
MRPLNGLQVQSLAGNKTSGQSVLPSSVVAERPGSSALATCLMLAQGRPFTFHTVPFDAYWLELAERLYSRETGLSPLSNHFSLLTLHERALLLRH